MPDPSPLDVNEFLAPISEENPSGESLRYEDDYAEIERAREEEEGAEDDPRWRKQNPKKADWELVITLGLKALKSKTKDVEIAAWVAEALSRRRGLGGIRDGLRLVRAIQDAFWETAHPASGDLELREGVYEFLDDEKRLPLLIRAAPIVSVPGLPAYSFLRFKESREVKNILMKEPDRADVLKSEGKIFPEDFDQAVDATERAFYDSTAALLKECIEATRELNQSLKAEGHYGPKGPVLSKTGTALDEVAKAVGQFLARKPALEPEPEALSVEETDSSWSSDAEAAVDQAAPTWEWEPDPDETVETARAALLKKSRPAARPSGGPINGPDDARSRIVEAARHLRQADASDPAPYLVVRALRMGERYRLAEPIDPSNLRPPTSEDRQSLRKLAGEGAWAELLELAEVVLGRPEGTGWLDPRRLALKALDELGLEEAARASKALLRAELHDYPDWPRSELDDGTPCAGAETRTWVEETFSSENQPGAGGGANYLDEPSSSEEEADRPRDPWDEAQELHRLGRPKEAISLIGRAARDAKTGRERFFRTFQQAELCLMMGRPGVATPLLEGLARQIDEFRLDRWEDPALCARVVGSLYKCIRGEDQARARTLYDRLCQLDIGQALGLGDGTDT